MPDILICRTEVDLDEEHLDKLSLFCNVPRSAVIVEKDVDISIYEIPLILAQAGLDEIILKQFCIDQPAKPLEQWSDLISSIKALEGEVVIGMVGKYAELQDAYKSVDEALIHAGYAVGKKYVFKN